MCNILKLFLTTYTLSLPAAPGSPSNVNVVDVDADKVKLEWTKPRNDGGRKVTGYVVEYKPVNATEWESTPVTKEPKATGRYKSYASA